MSKIAIVYHSGWGHTEAQAKAVAEGVKSVAGAEVLLVKVEGAARPEDVNVPWDDLAKADAIIFGSPTYMGSVSGPFKMFMDASSKVWFAYGWKGKLAAGFTNSGSQSGDKFNSLVQMWALAMQHAMIWVGLDLMPGNNNSKGGVDDLNRLGSFGGAMSQSNVDQGVEGMKQSDLKTAARLGARVAETAARMRG